MHKFTSVEKEDAAQRKLVPIEFKTDSKDGKLFQQKSEEKSVIVTRVTTYQLKILSSMDELERILRKSPEFVDPIDCFKQRKLFADFIVRFSRNYIYEIDRIVSINGTTDRISVFISTYFQIEEIQFYQIDHYSYFERSTNHLISKVCNLFAIIMRALQIYQKQLTKMNNENSDKLLHFMQLIVSGINLCVEIKIFDEDDMLIKVW